MAGILPRITGNLDPPALAPGRLVKEQFALVIGQKYREPHVVFLGPQRKVRNAASHPVDKVPQALSPEVRILAVQIAAAHKVGHAKRVELIAETRIAKEGTEGLTRESVGVGIALGRRVGCADCGVVNHDQIGIAHPGFGALNGLKFADAVHL